MPFALRFLLATDPDALTRVLGIAYRTILAYVLAKAGPNEERGSARAAAFSSGVWLEP